MNIGRLRTHRAKQHLFVALRRQIVQIDGLGG